MTVLSFRRRGPTVDAITAHIRAALGMVHDLDDTSLGAVWVDAIIKSQDNPEDIASLVVLHMTELEQDDRREARHKEQQ